mgnify:FL=1
METTSPDLRIVSLDTLVLHEREENGRREKLRERITNEGRLRNPVIAATIGEGERLLVIDGVHRYFALRDLGCRDALVQIVDYQDRRIKLYTWCRLIPHLAGFLAKTEALGLRAEKVEEKAAIRALESGAAYGYARAADKSCILIKGNNLTLNEKTEILQEILDSCGKLPRVRCEEVDENLKLGYAEGGLIVGAYTKIEVLELARSETKLPAGTTRHIVPGRVLNVDIPLDFLKSEIPTEEKNKILADRINRLTAEGRVRYYPEPVWLFDE